MRSSSKNCCDSNVHYLFVLLSGPYVPYSISVSAKTRIGVGEPRETVVFTLEGSMKLYTFYSVRLDTA